MIDKFNSKELTYDYLIEAFKKNSYKELSSLFYLYEKLLPKELFIYEAYRMLIMMKKCKCGDPDHKECLIEVLQELQKTKTLSETSVERFCFRQAIFRRTSDTVSAIRELILSSDLDSKRKVKLLQYFFDPDVFRREVIQRKTKQFFNLNDALGYYKESEYNWPEMKKIIEEVYSLLPKFLDCPCGREDCIETILKKPGAIPQESLKYLTEEKIIEFVQYAVRVHPKEAENFFTNTLHEKLRATGNLQLAFRFAEALESLKTTQCKNPFCEECIIKVFKTADEAKIKQFVSECNESGRGLNGLLACVTKNGFPAYQVNLAYAEHVLKTDTANEFVQWLRKEPKLSEEDMMAAFKDFVRGYYVHNLYYDVPKEFDAFVFNFLRTRLIHESIQKCFDVIIWTESHDVCRCSDYLCADRLTKVLDHDGFSMDQKSFFMEMVFRDFFPGASFDHAYDRVFEKIPKKYREMLKNLYRKLIFSSHRKGVETQEQCFERIKNQFKHGDLLMKEKKQKTYKVSLIFRDIAHREKVLEEGFLEKHFGCKCTVTKDRTFYLVLAFDKKPDIDSRSEGDYFFLTHIDKKKRSLLKAVKQSEVFPKQLKTFYRDDIQMTMPGQDYTFIPIIYDDPTTAKEWNRIFGEKK
jgi:hypothetical protein